MKIFMRNKKERRFGRGLFLIRFAQICRREEIGVCSHASFLDVQIWRLSFLLSSSVSFFVHHRRRQTPLHKHKIDAHKHVCSRNAALTHVHPPQPTFELLLQQTVYHFVYQFDI